MELKFLSLTILLILTIKCIQSKTAVRSFVVIDDKPPKPKPLTDFTAYDSREKDRLYLIRTTSTDIDTINIMDYRARKLVANVEGEWTNGIFNVTLSIYDNKSDKWIEGTMKNISKVFSTKYQIRWNGEKLYAKSNAFLKTIKIYNESPETEIAQFRYRSVWRSWTRYKYDLKIFTSKLPDTLFLAMLTVIHHQEQSREVNT